MKSRSLLTLLLALVPAILTLALIVFLLKKPVDSLPSLPPLVNKTPTQEKSVSTLPTNNKNFVIQYPTNNNLSPLGINTNEVFEQDASIPFIDLFRVATPFHENIRCRAQDQPCLTSASVEYNKQGWPIKLNGGKAGLFFLRNVPLKALPPGNFTVLYDGEGKIDYQQNIEVVSQKAGEDSIRFTERADGFMTAALQITESNPDNPLRNIRILMPGGICTDNPYQQVKSADSCSTSTYLDFKTHYATIIFNPDYLNFMKDFGVIRFMPMSGITRNPAEHWDQRPTLDEATWGGIYGSRGVPLDIQIELANRLKANPWLNVPHAADDDYMRQFASYVKQHLSPDLIPHIEYTNEAWNANFVHNEHMQKMGIKQKLDQDALIAGYKYYAKRSVEFFNIWEDVYGGNHQFIRIIGGWDTRPDISAIILAYNQTYESVDALAIAPYIGGNVRGFRAAKTVDDIFDLLSDKDSYRSLPKIMHELKKHADLAKTFGVNLIAYEGGQGLVDWAAKDYTQHPNPLFFAANRDPRMNSLYQDLYQQWRAMGAGLFVAFSAPRSCNWHGCWGLKEYIRQDISDAPKLKASLKFIEENERWWDWLHIKQLKKPVASEIAHYLPTPDNSKPRIVIRPAKGDPETFYRFVNPQALNILLEGESWDKQDLSGKWQVKWDEDNMYLSVKVYDKEFMVDSEDPTQDDSIEFFIDADNSRDGAFDQKNDFHIIFVRSNTGNFLNQKNKKTDQDKDTDKTEEKVRVFFGSNNPKEINLDIPFEMEKKYDGYELRAKISWVQLGITPKIADKISLDVIINDDDDGGKRDARISWNSRETKPSPDDFGMILISGR